MAKFTRKKVTGPTINRGEFKEQAHSSDTKISERPDVVGDRDEDRQYSVETIDVMPDKDYTDKLAFFEEPVMIRLEPSTDENAATTFPVWCNGEPAQLWQRNRWEPIGYLPVGKAITVKRKVVAIIASAKITRIQTEHKDENSGDEYIENKVKGFTRPLNSFSVLQDKNPKGHEWLTELIQRNF